MEVVDGKWVEFRCERVCNKKKSCGRHRCNTRCCVVSEHLITLILVLHSIIQNRSVFLFEWPLIIIIVATEYVIKYSDDAFTAQISYGFDI